MEATNTELHPALVAAGQWWANKLRGGAPGRNNGDNSPGGGMMAVASMLIEMRKPDAKVEVADALAAVIATRLAEKVARGCTWLTIDTDYRPGWFLSECMEAAGANEHWGRMPWKTLMSVSVDEKTGDIRVNVSEGYHAPTVAVYPIEQEGGDN